MDIRGEVAKEWCYSDVQEDNEGDGTSVRFLGQTFSKNVFTVFDMGGADGVCGEGAL